MMSAGDKMERYCSCPNWQSCGYVVYGNSNLICTCISYCEWKLPKDTQLYYPTFDEKTQKQNRKKFQEQLYNRKG